MPERRRPRSRSAPPPAPSELPPGAPTARAVRRRYDFGAALVSYMAITLLLALGAFNSQNNLLFWALGFAFAAIIVSGLLSGSMLMGLAASRRSPRPGQVGESVELGFTVMNRNRFTPAFGLWVQESRLMQPGTRAPGLLRRLLRRARGAGSEPEPAPPAVHIERPAFIEHISTRSSESVSIRLRCLRRGVVRLDRFRIASSFPFGLFVKYIEYAQPASLLIRPAWVRLKPGILKPLEKSGLGGATSRRRTGAGVDFFALREYTPGDSPRSISWRASARRLGTLPPSDSYSGSGTELLVRQTADTNPARLWIVLSLKPGIDTPEQCERAISAAATLARQAITRQMAAGVAVLGSGLAVSPALGASHVERILDALAELEVSALAEPAGRAFPRSALGSGALCIMLHAGPVDPSAAPLTQRLWHLSAGDIVDQSPEHTAPADEHRRAGAPIWGGE